MLSGVRRSGTSATCSSTSLIDWRSSNLFGAYAYTYDENRLDEFRELFTESPELVLQHDGHNLSGDIDAVMSLLLGKKR
jgi:hypothetical protein